MGTDKCVGGTENAARRVPIMYYNARRVRKRRAIAVVELPLTRGTQRVLDGYSTGHHLDRRLGRAHAAQVVELAQARLDDLRHIVNPIVNI